VELRVFAKNALADIVLAAGEARDETGAGGAMASPRTFD
jgi:hypothetical protein